MNRNYQISFPQLTPSPIPQWYWTLALFGECKVSLINPAATTLRAFVSNSFCIKQVSWSDLKFCQSYFHIDDYDRTISMSLELRFHFSLLSMSVRYPITPNSQNVRVDGLTGDGCNTSRPGCPRPAKDPGRGDSSNVFFKEFSLSNLIASPF